MLDLETAINLMKKYGYTSTTVHPYIYMVNNVIGVCYSFIDERFGVLERVALFRTSSEMDDFLKKYQWFKINGKKNNVTMKLDDYENPSPNIIYLRNGHVMAFDEMFNLEKYDNLEVQQKALNEVGRYISEAASLMDYYNARKDEQTKFFKHIDDILKKHKQTYYDLQLLVDKYNGTEHDRKISNLETRDLDSGININMERALKERLSQYKSNPPSKQEAIDFIEEVWNLCHNLELNKLYYQNKVYEQQLINDTKHGVKKIEFMKSILDSTNFFKKDLDNAFLKIDKELAGTDVVLNDDYVNKKIEEVNQKYSYYDKLDVLKVNTYLNETLVNSNYATLAIKYSQKEEKSEENIVLNYEAVIANLKEQFNSLSIVEQNSLILYFSDFGRLFNTIMKVDNYASISKEELVKNLERLTVFKDLKNIFYTNIKTSVELSSNEAFKKSIFANYDFSSLESFLESCINTLNIVKNIKGLVLNSDVDVFYITKDYDRVSKMSIVDTTNNVSRVNSIVKEGEKVVLSTLLKGSSILYSPRIIEFGDGSLTAKYSVKERTNDFISFAIQGLRFKNIDKPIVVSKYSSEVENKEGISIVNKLIITVKNTFFLTELSNKEVNKNEG